MPWSPLPAFPAHLHAAAAQIRLACFDVDGTLTDEAGQADLGRSGMQIGRAHV